MKNNICVIIVATMLGMVGNSFGATGVSITAPSATISADKAATATTPAWTTLSAITIGEQNGTAHQGEISGGAGATLVLKAPTGFQFNTGVTPSVSVTAGGDLSAASVAVNNSTTLTITLSVNN